MNELERLNAEKLLSEMQPYLTVKDHGAVLSVINRHFKEKNKLNEENRIMVEQLIALQEGQDKADKWDACLQELEKLYGDDEENPKDFDLIVVGEIACKHFKIY